METNINDRKREKDAKNLNKFLMLIIPIAFILGWAGGNMSAKNKYQKPSQQSSIQTGNGTSNAGNPPGVGTYNENQGMDTNASSGTGQ